MSTHDFVISVLNALADGKRVEIDRTMIFEIQPDAYHRREELRAAVAILEMDRDGVLRHSQFTQLAAHFERLSRCVELGESGGVFRMRDVDRASVYQEHLGERLKRRRRK